jgi:hypothetical protein
LLQVNYMAWPVFPVSFIGGLSGPYIVEVLMVAGGGGGNGKAAGGAGGLIPYFSFTMPGSRTNYPIVIGTGGGQAVSGTNTTFSTYTAIGGGKGGNYLGAGFSGGSGGGGHELGGGGAGTPGQGNAGGNGKGGNAPYTGGGGGGYSTAGQGYNSQDGGQGYTLDAITASLAPFAGMTVLSSGGGGDGLDQWGGRAGFGGTGAGNAGRTSTYTNAISFGSGGGGIGGGSYTGNGNGKSGVLVIRYLGGRRGLGGDHVTSTNNYTYHVFTSNGSYLSY